MITKTGMISVAQMYENKWNTEWRTRLTSFKKNKIIQPMRIQRNVMYKKL